MATEPFTLELLDPIQRPEPLPTELAPRLTGLSGIRLGLLENSKDNSDRLLDFVGEILQEQYGVGELVRRSKHSAYEPARPGVYDEIAASSDAVVTGVGD